MRAFGKFRGLVFRTGILVGGWRQSVQKRMVTKLGQSAPNLYLYFTQTLFNAVLQRKSRSFVSATL